VRRVLPRALVKLIAQSHGPIRQLAVRSPEGIGERIEGVTPLPELVELGSHLVGGAVLVAGAALKLLSPTSQDL
jgi:C4-dicarboxylate transporter